MNYDSDHRGAIAAAADADERRLAAIVEFGLLDRVGDPVLTALARLARAVTGAEAAAVHIFDADHQRRIAAAGAPLVDHPAQDSMCLLVVQQGSAVVTYDATTDPRFAYSSFVKDPVAPVRFYAAVPLKSGEITIGTLCTFDTHTRELDDEQIARLADVAEIARAHLELMRIAGELGNAATLDPLTAVFNRVIFNDHLAQALARRRRRGTPVFVAVVDIDDFKAINDTHGHARGDTALQWVARRLRDSVRSEDTVGRLGGDEFGVVAEVTDRDFDRLLMKLRQAGDGFELPLSVSVGVALADDHDDVASVLQRADQAMYAEKLHHKRSLDRTRR